MLTQALNAQITAVDFLQDFLDILNQKAKRAGLADRMSSQACSMDDLPFTEGELDAIYLRELLKTSESKKIGLSDGASLRRVLSWLHLRSRGSRILEHRNSRSTEIASILRSS